VAAGQQQQAIIRIMTSPQSAYADPKHTYDNSRYYALHITASQLLGIVLKLHDDPASVVWSCSCEFAGISQYISKTL